MTDLLLWVLVFELTVGLLWGGYRLSQIHTALTQIIRQHCDATVPEVFSTPPVLTAEVLDAEPTQTDDATDTVGTFTGAPWR